MTDRRFEMDQTGPLIFEISRRNPQQSWGERVAGHSFPSVAGLLLFDQMGKRITELAVDQELKGILVLDDGESLRVKPIIPDIHAETNLSGIFNSGIRPHSLLCLNGAPVEDVVIHHNPSDGQIVGVLKFVA